MDGFIYSVLGLIILGMGITIAMRSNAKKPVEAILYIGSFMTVLLSALGLIIFLGPATYEFIVEDALPNFWGPVLGNRWDDTWEAGETVADIVNYRDPNHQPFMERIAPAPASVSPSVSEPIITNLVETQPAAPEVAPITQISTPEVTYTIQPGDTLAKISNRFGVEVNELAALNQIANPSRIAVGQVLIISKPVHVEVAPQPTAESTAAPQPTATPRPTINWTTQLNRLDTAWKNGDLETGLNTVNQILNQEPQHPEANRFYDNIQAAIAVRSEWESLNTDIVNGSSEAEYISALSGFSFQILSVQTAFMTSKSEEIIRLRCTTPGWMFGQEIKMTRLIGANLGVPETVGATHQIGG